MIFLFCKFIIVLFLVGKKKCFVNVCFFVILFKMILDGVDGVVKVMKGGGL